MRELSGMDAAFLAIESPQWPMHVASVTVFDPTELEGGYSVERLKQTLLARLHRLPPFRWRAVEPPLGLARPRWIEDPDFDIDYHVRRIAVPSPGGREELAALASDLYRQLLDRRRPLWEWWVVEGLEDGLVACVWKIHHACIDGMSGAGMQEVMFDATPDAPDPTPPPGYRWRPERVPGGVEMLLRSLPFFAGTPKRVLEQVPGVISSVTNIVREGLTDAVPTSVPRTSFNAAVTQRRSFGFVSVSLTDVKRVKNAFGTKVNDVVLSICAASLRRYLEARGELPEPPLVASVPINVRADGSPGHGNQVSGMMADLATDVAEPVERLMRIHRFTQGAKEMHDALGAETIMNLADTPPPMMLSLALRLYASNELVERHRPLFNIIISNVPGPRAPLYSLGAEVKAFYPMGICFDGVGMFIGLMSYRDQIDFGVLACGDLVPDPFEIADGIQAGLAELVVEADKRSAPQEGASDA